MSKFKWETRVHIADAYGNRSIKDRVFHCICFFMRFINKLRVNYGFRQDDKGRMQGPFIYREGIYKLAKQLWLLWWDNHLQWSSCSFGTILPIWFHSVLIYVCLQLAMVLILRVVTPMKTDKQIENICKEHVPNVILELSGKIRWSIYVGKTLKMSHVRPFLGCRQIAVNNGANFGRTPVSECPGKHVQ